MRIKNLDELGKLGANAKRQIEAALKLQGGFNNQKRASNIEALKHSSTTLVAAESNKTAPPKKKKRPAKVMIHSDGGSYCPYPNPDPSVALHIALLREFGSWWDGGELADEMIIPGHSVRFRYDFCFPRYRLAIHANLCMLQKLLHSIKTGRHSHVTHLSVLHIKIKAQLAKVLQVDWACA